MQLITFARREQQHNSMGLDTGVLRSKRTLMLLKLRVAVLDCSIFNPGKTQDQMKMNKSPRINPLQFVLCLFDSFITTKLFHDYFR